MPAVASLQDLVAPLSEDAFTALLRERKLTHLRGEDADRFSSLLDWERLLGMIERGEHPRGYGEFRLARESVNIPWDRWLTRGAAPNTTRIDIAKVEQYLAEGFSMIVMPIEPYVPALAELCHNIRTRVSEQIRVGVIVTAGAGGAFKLHYDPEDLIILQLEGTKRWRIFGPPVPNPVAGMAAPTPPPEQDPIFDEVLQPGDFLFLPAGTWHHCQNGPGRSLHLGVFFIPPTSWHAVKTLTSRLMAEEQFRVPLTRLNGASDLAAFEDEIKTRLAAEIERLRLADFLDKWAATERVTSRKAEKGTAHRLNDFLADWNKKDPADRVSSKS